MCRIIITDCTAERDESVFVIQLSEDQTLLIQSDRRKMIYTGKCSDYKTLVLQIYESIISFDVTNVELISEISNSIVNGYLYTLSQVEGYRFSIGSMGIPVFPVSYEFEDLRIFQSYMNDTVDFKVYALLPYNLKSLYLPEEDRYVLSKYGKRILDNVKKDSNK